MERQLDVRKLLRGDMPGGQVGDLGQDGALQPLPVGLLQAAFNKQYAGKQVDPRAAVIAAAQPFPYIGKKPGAGAAAQQGGHHTQGGTGPALPRQAGAEAQHQFTLAHGQLLPQLGHSVGTAGQLLRCGTVRCPFYPAKQPGKDLLGIIGAAAPAEKYLYTGRADQLPVAAIGLLRCGRKRLLHRTVAGQRKPTAPAHLSRAALGRVAAFIVDLRLDGINKVLLLQPEGLLREGIALHLRLQQYFSQQLGAAPADALPLQRKAVIRPGNGEGEQLVFAVAGNIGIQHCPVEVRQAAFQLGHIPAAAAAHAQQVCRQHRRGGLPLRQRCNNSD